MEVSALQPRVNAADIQPERLAGNPALSETQKIAEASRQFEAILLKQILDSSQKTVIQSKYSDNSTSSSIYHDMVTNQLADSISKSGSFGLSKTFEQQLQRQDHAAAKDAASTAHGVTAASRHPPADSHHALAAAHHSVANPHHKLAAGHRPFSTKIQHAHKSALKPLRPLP
jgi:peptidoglycan hydrolase FlgJ